MPVGDRVESRLGERGRRPLCYSGWRVNTSTHTDGIEVEARYVRQ